METNSRFRELVFSVLDLLEAVLLASHLLKKRIFYLVKFFKNYFRWEQTLVLASARHLLLNCLQARRSLFIS